VKQVLAVQLLLVLLVVLFFLLLSSLLKLSSLNSSIPVILVVALTDQSLIEHKHVEQSNIFNRAKFFFFCPLKILT
jgi:glycerol-3-phosphate acyltransferase PlsY